MKTKFLIVFALIASVFVGCKDGDKESESTDLTKQVKVQDGVKVSFEATIKKDDEIHLYYTQDGSINFTPDQLMVTKVVGSANPQVVSFDFPEDVLPNEIRFDMGTNLAQEPIILKSVKIEYKGKTRVFVGTEVGSYFRADGSTCDYDIATGTITGKVVDGKRVMPLIYPHEVALKQEIEKLWK